MSWPRARTGCSISRRRSARSSSGTGPWRACAPTSTALRTWWKPRTATTPASWSPPPVRSTARTTRSGCARTTTGSVGSPLRSRWSYAEAKAIDESLIDAYVRERGLWAVIARLFNTVGPRQTGRYGMVIPRFVRQALAGEPLTVFGTGEQVRCFCHVHDVIPALTALIETDQACGRAVNLGSSEQVSIGELARRVIRLTGSASAIERLSYLEVLGSGYEDMMRRVPDCTLAGDLVGFRATRTLDDILRAVIDEQISRGADAVGPRSSWPRPRRPPDPDGWRGAVRIDVPARRDPRRHPRRGGGLFRGRPPGPPAPPDPGPVAVGDRGGAVCCRGRRGHRERSFRHPGADWAPRSRRCPTGASATAPTRCSLTARTSPRSRRSYTGCPRAARSTFSTRRASPR